MSLRSNVTDRPSALAGKAVAGLGCVVALLLCAGSNHLAAATLQAGILDDDRTIDWTDTGVPGGIPERRTIFATIDAARFGDGTSDAAPAIQGAMVSCPADQVVFLPAGTYRLDSTLDFKRLKGVVLRGAGPGKTILVPNGKGPGIANSSILLSEPRPIVSGSTKGSTTVTLGDASGIAPGVMVDVYQDPDPDLFWSRSAHTWSTGQWAMVTSVSGNTVELEDPLVWNFSRNPQLRFHSQECMRWCGIEDLTIKADTEFRFHLIRLWNTYAFWIRNIETIGGKYFTDGSDTVHVSLYGCLRSELRDSYLHDAPSAFGLWLIKSWSAEDGSGGCTGLRVQNNIFSKLGLGIITEGGSGNVFAYNFFRDTAHHGWPDYQVPDLNGNHGEHGMMHLYEGNVLIGYQSDGYHGSASHMTLFRNSLTGQHVEAKRTGNVKTIDLCRYSYHFNIVGNVLGNPEWPSKGNGAYEMTGQPGYEVQTVIYRLGYPNMGNNGFHATNPPSNNDQGGYDPTVKDTLLRFGNFDYQDNAPRWDAAELPKGATVPKSKELPPSFYLSEKPAWWGEGAWPAIGPDVKGLTNKIPAQERYEAIAAGK